jgi:hypothetical protein
LFGGNASGRARIEQALAQRRIAARKLAQKRGIGEQPVATVKIRNDKPFDNFSMRIALEDRVRPLRKAREHSTKKTLLSGQKRLRNRCYAVVR